MKTETIDTTPTVTTRSKEETVNHALSVLTGFMREGKCTFIRRKSVRYKVYSFLTRKNTTLYFLYDKEKNCASKLISEKEAIFRINEEVRIVTNWKIYKGTIIQIVAKGEIPAKYKELLSQYTNHEKVLTFTQLHDVDTVLVNSNNSVYLYTLSRIRKVDELDEKAINKQREIFEKLGGVKHSPKSKNPRQRPPSR